YPGNRRPPGHAGPGAAGRHRPAGRSHCRTPRGAAPGTPSARRRQPPRRSPMIKALLCDLDGTLLNIDFAGFMKDYLEGAARYFEDCIPPEVFQRQVLVSTGAILANDQPGRTMLQAFMDHFSQALTLPPDTLDRFQKYY